MKPVRTFTVTPSLPPRLERLRELAHNLRWSWDHSTIELFRRLDSDLWESTWHNPVLMLGTIDQSRLEAAAADEGFGAHFDGVCRHFDAYMAGESAWFPRTHGPSDGPAVAYFSAEFGVTECLSIFAGGLGVLAGDHLKSASDLGVPLVGVGLLYQQGYFQQYLNEAGWQQEACKDNDFYNLPLRIQRQRDGTPVVIGVSYPGRQVNAQLWRADVGRIPLYLLDTNLLTNAPEDRGITYQLYGGDLEMRIKQEIMLGIGGYRAVECLGLRPAVYHMNEGHSAFLSLERTRLLMEEHGLSFEAAREVASAGLVFTTHTPVAAGQDYFPPDLMERYFADYARTLGVSWKEFLALGRQDAANESEAFCMTVLALRLAAHSNGVSRLHGRVSRTMWQGIWPGVPEDEIPIGHVTNGIHIQSWTSMEMKELYDRYLGPRWREEPVDQAVWQRAAGISGEELWRTHERRRERMVAFARRRLRGQLVRRGASMTEMQTADEVLDPKALTIGFGRRFATYKRATLLLRDLDRLAAILNNPERPVQVIFAGKAHPRDDPGKELIRRIVAVAREERFRRRLVFLEDYDMAVARYLVQGADVWLNTPLRPREASGTSGMKAAANGVLNLSTLDGWWDEAYQPEAGWAIGRGETYENADYQDQVEAEALYELLEREVVPAYYERGADGLPRRWIARIKASVGSLCHDFNTHRMVGEYTTRIYLPAGKRCRDLAADGMARGKALAAWKARVEQAWPQVRVEAVENEPLRELDIRGQVLVRARIHLGTLGPDDVSVELYLGRVNLNGEIVQAEAMPMLPRERDDQGNQRFEAAIVPRTSGLHGFTVRVLAHHPDLVTRFVPGLIHWA